MEEKLKGNISQFYKKIRFQLIESSDLNISSNLNIKDSFGKLSNGAHNIV